MSKSKAVLLSRAQADLKAIVSKDETRHVSVMNIHVTKEYAEATDGHMLLRVPHNGLDAREFPAIKGVGEGLNSHGTLVDPKLLEKAIKSTDQKPHLEILRYVHLSLDKNGAPILTATDLETGVNFRQKKVDAEFPDTSHLIPRREKLTVCLKASLLGRLADWTEKNGNQAGAIDFFVGNATETILCRIPRDDGPDAIAVIAPMRSTYKEPEQKPIAEEDQRRGWYDEFEEELTRAVLSPFC